MGKARLTELIKVKGFQVAPAEVEGRLLSHPEVADCAVIPEKDARVEGGVKRKEQVAKSIFMGGWAT